jgi:hypothetical protein
VKTSSREVRRAATHVSQSDSGHPVTFHFCPECGSTVFWTPQRKPETIAVAVGAFADPAFPAPTQVVYSERSHPWVTSPAAAAGPQLKTAIPILRIFSVEEAKEFYIDFLGFAIDWEHRFGENLPLYAQISRSGLKLHLSEHHGDACPGATVFIWMRGVAEYHGELTATNYRYAKPGLEKAPWDAWVMEVGDPFGNRLRFSEPLASDDPRA